MRYRSLLSLSCRARPVFRHVNNYYPCPWFRIDFYSLYSPGTVQFVRRRVGATQQAQRSGNVAQGGSGGRTGSRSGALELRKMAREKRELWGFYVGSSSSNIYFFIFFFSAR